MKAVPLEAVSGVRDMNRLYRTAIAIVVGLVTWSGGLQLCGNWTASEAVTYDSLFPGVCLDAGHGGPGACKWAGPPDYCTNGGGYNEYRGCSGPNGLTEAWVNHEIVPLAMDAFATDNIYVACTRQTITDNIPYQTRCDLANNDASVDVFVSVHHEGSTEFQETRTFCKDDPDVPNPETGKWRYKIALALANEINRRFGYGMQVKVDTEAGHDSIFVLRNTWMPSALTEASSIGHESEEDLMANDYWHRRDEALGITDGFLAYADTLTCPQNFDCDCDEDADGYAYFWWDGVEGADGYYLYRDPDHCPPTPESGSNVYNVTWWTWPKSWVGYWDCLAVQAYVTGPGARNSLVGYPITSTLMNVALLV